MTPTRQEVIRVARECGAFLELSTTPEKDMAFLLRFAERFYEAGAAAAREHGFQRRGVLLFNPYSGKPRHPSDIASDPHGILMLDPEQPLYAAKATGEKT